MKRSTAVCVLACLLLASNSFAKTYIITDTRDSKSWGDWFTDTEPTDYNPYFYSPYFRFNNEDWGWTHTITFEEPATDIVSATLEINAWDVDILDQEIHDIYADDIYIGHLIPNHNESNAAGYKADWCVTNLTFSSDAMLALVDGEVDMWIDIDAGRYVENNESSAWGVTLGYSTLTIVYESDPLEDPLVPPDDTVDPKDDPNEPNDPNEPTADPNEPSDGSGTQLKTYSFGPVDLSLPTVNDPGDGIGQIGVEQAWFAFDLSIIPDDEQVISASFSANMCNYTGDSTERTLWYHADDSWIDTTQGNLSDPGNIPADGPVVGTVIHDNTSWSFITIDIDINAHDFSSDLIDNYITLMLTGPSSRFYSGGVVYLATAELEITTLSASGQIIDDNNDVLLTLGPEEFVQADGYDIVVPGYSVPSCFDWNNDGLQDLIIGQGGSSGNAKVLVYLNIGTESDPQFSDGFSFYAQSSGSDLTCPASGCLGCFPRVLYWDADDNKDMLVGQADGTIKLFMNVWTDIVPIFDGGTFLTVGKTGFKSNIDAGARATLSVVDWNNDGRKDLVVGALDGKIRVFINKGTDTEPDFVLESLVQENGSDLVVPGGRSSPDVLDLDYDGRKDILTGNTDGQLLFYRNIGTDDTPMFSGYTLVESKGVAIDLAGTPRSRPYLCYWNEDYYPDVLVGAGDGKVHLYRGISMLDGINGK